MGRSPHHWFEQLELTKLLSEHPGLRIVPSEIDGVTVAGQISFEGPGEDGELLADTYNIETWVLPSFPASAPLVRETDNRIPGDFHKLEGNFLCLGAPMALRLRLKKDPNLPTFFTYFVVPYLFGYSFFCKYGKMPFGELAHGAAGIEQYFCELFAAEDAKQALEFLRLAGMKKGEANKQPCPCGSGKRLGRCHNRRLNQLRRRFGRSTFREEYEWLLGRR